MPKYEAHITFHKRDAAKVKATDGESGWKYSEIDGDPVMDREWTCVHCRKANAIMAERCSGTLTDDWGHQSKCGRPRPLLATKPYCYLTAYDNDPIRLIQAMHHVSDAFLDEGVEVLREKVEQIIYDTKTGVDAITPPAPRDAREWVCEECGRDGMWCVHMRAGMLRAREIINTKIGKVGEV